MPTFAIPYPAFADAAVIEAAEHNANNAAIETHLVNEAVQRDGSIAFTSPIAGQDPTSASHLSTKSYVDAATGEIIFKDHTTNTAYFNSTSFVTTAISSATFTMPTLPSNTKARAFLSITGLEMVDDGGGWSGSAQEGFWEFEVREGATVVVRGRTKADATSLTPLPNLDPIFAERFITNTDIPAGAGKTLTLYVKRGSGITGTKLRLNSAGIDPVQFGIFKV